MPNKKSKKDTKVENSDSSEDKPLVRGSKKISKKPTSSE